MYMRVNQRYEVTLADGRKFGPWEPGDIVDLEVSALGPISRDAPGVLEIAPEGSRPINFEEARMTVEPKWPAEGVWHFQVTQDYVYQFGRMTVAWQAGDEIDLAVDLANAVNDDAPGTLVPLGPFIPKEAS